MHCGKDSPDAYKTDLPYKTASRIYTNSEAALLLENSDLPEQALT